MRPAIALAALALLTPAGCLYYEEPDDDLAQAVRDAEAAEQGVVRRGRGAPWYLVRIWVREVAADSPPAGGPAPAGDPGLASSLVDRRKRVRAAGIRAALVLPPEEPHASILLRQGQAGFAALARGVTVPVFDEAGASVGGLGLDRGFTVTVTGVEGKAAVEVAPAFREPRPGGAETRVDRLAFVCTLAPGEGLSLDAAPDAADRGVRALFFDDGEGGGARRRRLVIQVEAFR